MTTQPITHDHAAVDSAAMHAWYREINDVAEFLSETAYCHTKHNDHALCEDAIAWLLLAFADIGLTEQEAKALIGGFTDWQGTPLATLEKIALLWARYHATEADTLLRFEQGWEM